MNIGMQTVRILYILCIEDLEGAHVPGVMSACSTAVPSLSTVQYSGSKASYMYTQTMQRAFTYYMHHMKV